MSWDATWRQRPKRHQLMMRMVVAPVGVVVDAEVGGEAVVMEVDGAEVMEVEDVEVEDGK